MTPVVSFSIIVGETSARKAGRRLQPASLLLFAGAVAGCWVPGWAWLAAGSAIGYAGILAWALVLGQRRQFVLDGQVEFYEDELRLRGHVLPLTELRRVEAHFTFARGESAGPNQLGDEGNKLLLYQRQQALPQRLTVLVTSRAQRTVLNNLLLRWRQRGHEVLADVL